MVSSEGQVAVGITRHNFPQGNHPMERESRKEGEGQRGEKGQRRDVCVCTEAVVFL